MKIKRKKSFTMNMALILLGLMVIFYAALHINNEKQQKEKSKIKDKAIFSLDTKNLESLSFMISGERRTFYNTDKGWTCDIDPAFPVKESQMTVLTDQLRKVLYVRKLTKVREDQLAEYGLDKPSNIIRIRTKDGNESRISIGKTNSLAALVYVYMNDDKSKVYTVDGDLGTVFKGSLMNYAQGEDFPTITVAGITSIKVDGGQNSYQILPSETYNSGWQFLDQEGKAWEADSSAVRSMEEIAAGLKFENYYEYNCKDFKPYGLDQPAYKLEISYRQGDASGNSQEEKKLLLLVGKKSSLGEWYVSLEGSKEVHGIVGDSLESLLQLSLGDLRNKAVLKIAMIKMKTMEVNYKGENHDFQRKEKDKKSLFTMDGKKIDLNQFSSFYNKLANLSAQEMTDEKTKEKPEMVIDCEGSDGKREKVGLYPYNEIFYLALDQYENGYLLNKLEVKDMLAAYESLVENK